MATARARRSSRSVRLTPRGRVFAGLSIVFPVVAYWSGTGLLLVVGCLLLALTAIALALARFRSMDLSVERSFSPSPVAATTPVKVTITAANLSPSRSAPLYWNDILPWRPLATDPVHLDSLPRFTGGRLRTTTLAYEVTPPHRGVVSVGPLTVAYSDPFGLAVGFVTFGGTSELVVTPRVVDLPASGVWLEAPDGNARLVQTRGIGNSDDLMTREYRRGDALRRVHWRASARHGQLMVRQEEQRAYPEATIVVDTRERGYRDHRDGADVPDLSVAFSDDFEWAVSMLASLGVHLHRSGFVVHVTETGRPQVAGLAAEGAPAAREDEFLFSLARLRLQHERGRPTGSASEGPIFAILSDPDEDTIAWLLDMRRSFELGVVFVIGASRRVVAEFSLAGWRVIPVDAHTNPVIAWRVLAEDLGVASASR